MIIEIEGKKVEVDDSFKNLSPDQQNATVDEIAKSLGISNEPQQVSASPNMLGADRRMANDEQVAAQTSEGRKEAYDQLPWYQQAAQAGMDVGRLMRSGATFGFGDKIDAVSDPTREEGVLNKTKAALNILNPAAAMGEMLAKTVTGDEHFQDRLKEERAQTQEARDRAGNAALPAEIAGGVFTGTSLANSGATLAGRMGTATMKGLPGVAARAGLMVPEGAAYGIVDALGNDRDVKEGATIGAIAGPVGSIAGDAVGAVATKLFGKPATNAKIPDLTKLKEAARDAYNQADNAGVIIKPEPLQNLTDAIKSDLTDFGYHPKLQPRISVVLDELDRVSQGNVTLKGLDTVRKIADTARASQDPAERKLGVEIVNQIDDFIGNMTAKDVIAGDPLKGAKALKDARSLWSRVAKNEKFLNAVSAAELRASSTGSGGNIENATRQNVRRLLEKGRGFTADEKAAMEEIVRGTPGQNFLRLAGKLSPQGNGLMAALGVGGAMVNPTFGAASLAGLAAKYAADKGTMRGVQAMDELIRAGGDRTALESAKKTLAALTESQRQTIARIVQDALIFSETRGEQPAQ